MSQVVGLTEHEVSYHRPAANGRAVWGALVPYGQVWRAGANENTMVSARGFSPKSARQKSLRANGFRETGRVCATSRPGADMSTPATS
ncbi:MAG: DUF2911 domain-containing protein [Thermoanaerobaculia bacterium]